MTYYIVAHRNTLDTARLIRRYIEERIQRRVFITTNPEVLNRIYTVVLANWGNSFSDFNIQDEQLLNDRLQYVVNKHRLVYKASRREYEIQYDHIINIRYGIPSEFPAVVRDIINGDNSRTVRVVQSPDELDESLVYYSTYIPFAAEYRILIMRTRNGLTVEVHKKIGDNPMVEHNYRWLRRPKIKGLKKLIEAVDLWASNSFGSYLVGVDAGRDQDNRLWLIEVNSAPSLWKAVINRLLPDYVQHLRSYGVIK